MYYPFSLSFHGCPSKGAVMFYQVFGLDGDSPVFVSLFWVQFNSPVVRVYSIQLYFTFLFVLLFLFLGLHICALFNLFDLYNLMLRLFFLFLFQLVGTFFLRLFRDFFWLTNFDLVAYICSFCFWLGWYFRQLPFIFKSWWPIKLHFSLVS